jgi:hypothetical protein
VAELLAQVRARPAPALAAVAAGLLLGFAVALATRGGGNAGRPTTIIELAGVSAGRVPSTPAVPEGEQAADAGAPSAVPAAGAAAAEQEGMRAALARGVAAAERFGGRAEAAVWLDGWPGPVVVGGGAASRMWSMSKAVTAVAVFERARGGPQGELAQALDGALTRSENCAQRRVIVGLQTLAGGVERARAAFDDVLRRAGADASLTLPAAAPEQQCVSYLQQHGAGVPDPLQAAYQYGTATWTIDAAVRFAHALGSGGYGAAGEQVLELLRRPKGVSREIQPGEFTADPAWGAGRAFARWQPAYKAGWGGAQTHDFVVGQIAVVRVGARIAAVAVTYHPARQPAADDPGQVDAATGLEALLDGVADQLGRVQQGR